MKGQRLNREESTDIQEVEQTCEEFVEACRSIFTKDDVRGHKYYV
jgi:hypothetical protein